MYVIDRDAKMTAVKSASRVIAILELFEAERRALRINDIVEALGYPQSSVSTLMKTLVASGYISFDAQERSYSPSPQLAFLGHWALGHRESVEVIQGIMRRLSDATSMSVMLGARNGITMQYIHFVVAESEFAMRLREGTQRPLHRSALGLMLMTNFDDVEAGRVIQRYQLEHPGEFEEPLSDALERLRLARIQGYFLSNNLIIQGASVLAALMPTPPNSRRFAIGIGGLTEKMNENWAEFLQALKAATQEYAEAMARLKDRGF